MTPQAIVAFDDGFRIALVSGDPEMRATAALEQPSQAGVAGA